MKDYTPIAKKVVEKKENTSISSQLPKVTPVSNDNQTVSSGNMAQQDRLSANQDRTETVDIKEVKIPLRGDTREPPHNTGNTLSFTKEDGYLDAISFTNYGTEEENDFD